MSAKKAALVTNASDYAGPPAVDALLSADFRVLVHDRTFADPDIWRKYSNLHPQAEYIAAENPEDLIRKAWTAANEIAVIVSNDHHPAVNVPTEMASLEALRRTLEVLVVEPFSLLKSAIPFLKAQGGGNIIMITSCRTQLPMPGGAIPDAARAAENALVRSLAIELAPFDIAINAIAPNFLYSEAYFPRALFIDDTRGKDYVASSVPAGRLGEPAEIGEIIKMLATIKGRFMTGAILDFSGAWPAAAVRPS